MIVLLIRGESGHKPEIVKAIMEKLNPDVNSVKADLVSIHDCENKEEKADSRTCKNLFKRFLQGMRDVIVVDHPLKTRNEWLSYLKMGEEADPGCQFIGINCGDDVDGFSGDLSGKSINVTSCHDHSFVAFLSRI